MGSIYYDPGVRGMRGRIGGFVHYRQPDGTFIVGKRPLPNPNRIPTEAQARQLERFREASAHYKNVMENAEVKEAYRKIAFEHGSAKRLRGIVMGDILKPPTIQAVDLAHYTGLVGDTIRIVAQDNVAVARIRLVVRDNTARLDLEAAEKVMGATLTETVEWTYTSTVALPDESLNHQVDITVAAYDLAGNEVTSTVSARP